MKHFFLFLINGIISTSLLAQHSLQWGKPSASEINLKTCSFDSTANAVILAENGSITFISGYAYIKVYRKIKILNAKGSEHANIQIPFFVGNALEDVKDIKAQTINIENGILKQTDLGEDEIFDNVLSSKWHEMRFAFPSVKEGSILEYKYTLVTKRITFLEAWIFQHPIPTLYSEIKVSLPDYLIFSVLLFGDRLREKYEKKSDKKDIWVLTNIPGYEQEHNVYCYEDYIDQIQFQLKSYESNDGPVDVLNTWDQLAKKVRENHQLYLGRNMVAKEILLKIIQVNDSKEEKIKKIYNFIFPFRVEYNFIQTQQTINELLNSRSGNSSEVNLLLCLLLNEAEIPAYPVLISTKSNGKVIKNYPFLDQFNHIIIALEENGSYRFLDAASQSSNAYLIPYSNINFSGFLLKKSENKWINIEYPTVSKENILLKCKIGSSDIKAQLSSNTSGYFAFNKRQEYKHEKKKEPEFFLSNFVMTKDSATNENLDDEYKDYTETYYYSASYKSENKLFLNLNFYGDENPYKQKERLFPVELGFPYSRQVTYSIKLQPDDTIKNIPKNLALNLDNEGVSYGKFTYKTERLPNKLIVITQLEMTKTLISRDYYEYLKEFYNRVILKLNEPIIVEKK